MGALRTAARPGVVLVHGRTMRRGARRMNRNEVEEREDAATARVSPRPLVIPSPGATDGYRRQEPVAPPRRRRLGASRLALLLVILLGAGLCALHIHSYRQLSQYDEAQHVDYVYYLLRGELPKSGDRW